MDCGNLDLQLWQTVDENDIARGRELLEKGASVNARHEGFWSATVLMIACDNKNKAMVDLLCKRGAAVNETDYRGCTALMVAARTGDVEVFDLLLEHNADVMKKDYLRGWTAMHYAAEYDQKTILDRFLLSNLLPVDTSDNYGQTPLWLTARNRHMDCVKVLLVHGANPNHKSMCKESPLDVASRCRHTSIVSMMTEELKSPTRQYAISVISKLKENIHRHEKKIHKQEMEMHQLMKDIELLKEMLRQSVQQAGTKMPAEVQQNENQLEQLSSAPSCAKIGVERTDEHTDATESLFLTLDIRVNASDGMVQPVTSSVSSEIGPEGGKVQFQSPEVFLAVPEGSVPSATSFYLETYVDPACLPPVTSEEEVPLSPSYHLSSSLPKDHHFTKPLQLSLPLEVPLKASDTDSGWLLQLKRSETSSGVPTKWHTVLELNTKTGDVVSRSSSFHYDHASGTLLLDHFSWFAWLGEALKAVGGMFGFSSSLRQIDYAVFGKEIQHHKWLIAAHIIHRSKVLYESLAKKLKERDYIELSYPNTDCIQLNGEVSVQFRCLDPWQVQQGKPEVLINTNRIWASAQHSSCYHEVTIEDSNLSADTLECTIKASFRAKGDKDPGESVELVISHPLRLTKPETGTLALSLFGVPGSEGESSSTPTDIDAYGSTFDTEKVFQAVVSRGCNHWYSLCVQMGYSSGQVEDITSRIPSDADKIRAVFDKKIDAVGESDATAALLEACRRIPNPIIGSVMDILSK